LAFAATLDPTSKGERVNLREGAELLDLQQKRVMPRIDPLL
jgi:hypothetical protein